MRSAVKKGINGATCTSQSCSELPAFCFGSDESWLVTDRKRVLFLFNHDAAHQVAHSASIMSELAASHPQIETIAGTGNAAIEAQLRNLLPALVEDRIHWVDLSLDPLYDAILSVPNAVLPAKRLARLRTNEDFFSSVDALISTERTCLRVKERLRAKNASDVPLFFYIPHGAGDRSVAYHPSLAQFDFHLLSGKKIVDEMVAHGIATKDQCRIIGYAKFDAVAPATNRRFFKDDKPVILYNPHFDPHLSSWYTMGPQLLDELTGLSDQFNVIFAPHVMLFRKKLHISPEYRVMRVRPDVPNEVAARENVLVDTASPALFDMTYTSFADIYIGDVSSQVYEFLRSPKPCFFIDSAAQGADSYPFWANGPVVGNVRELLDKIGAWQEVGAQHRAVQRELFQYTIDHNPARSASQRGAQAIAQIVGQPG